MSPAFRCASEPTLQLKSTKTGDTKLRLELCVAQKRKQETFKGLIKAKCAFV